MENRCRYITRPAISEKRLSISPQGKVRYRLKTPWRNGTTHVEWMLLDKAGNYPPKIGVRARAACAAHSIMFKNALKADVQIAFG